MDDGGLTRGPPPPVLGLVAREPRTVVETGAHSWPPLRSWSWWLGSPGRLWRPGPARGPPSGPASWRLGHDPSWLGALSGSGDRAHLVAPPRQRADGKGPRPTGSPGRPWRPGLTRGPPSGPGLKAGENPASEPLIEWEKPPQAVW